VNASAPPAGQALGRASGALLLSAGVVVLAGWLGGWPAARAAFLPATPLRADAALCFALVGLGLLLRSIGHGSVARACGALAAGVAGLHVLHALGGDVFTVGQWFVRDDAPVTGAGPGVLRLGTAAGLLLLCLALWSRSVAAGQGLALAAGTPAVASFVASLTGEGGAPGSGLDLGMPPLAALLLLVGVAGTLAGTSRAGVLGIVTSARVGGGLARRLLPWTLAVPPAVALLRVWGQGAGLWEPSVGVTLSEILTMLTLSLVVWLAAAELSAVDERRERAEAELARSYSLLQVSSEELRRSNADLEEFAFVASHDLREPLRKVAAFGDLLRGNLGSGLDAQSLDYLQRMERSAARMNELLDSLLEFSRVASRQQPLEPTDLGQLARDAISDLELRIAEAGATVRVSELPTLAVDRSQFRRVFQNLIGNALKFRAPGRAPEIEVRAEPVPEGWSLVVSDNGIGFDQKYAERIFRPFQRLHSSGEYKGSGMGLAICRKIVARHGGWIGATSAPGRGARFQITLPAGPRPAEGGAP
jgi:signal transduction histidine kinase